jgi:hypothetical protein
MARTDLYHKVKIEEIIDGIKKSPRQKDRERGMMVETNKIVLSEGANLESITKFEKENKILLPQDYKTFLMFSNGAGLFGLDLSSIEEVHKIRFSYLNASERDCNLNHLYIIANQANGDYNSINLQMPRGAKDPNRRDILGRALERNPAGF